MAWVATAVVGSALIGAGTSYLAGKKQEKAIGKASKAELEASQTSQEYQRWLYEETKAMNQPWVDVGLKALGQLQRYAGVSGSATAQRPSLVKRADLAAEAERQVPLDRQRDIRNMSDSDYIKYVYQEGLGREADQSGLNYWVSELSKGKDRNEIAQKMGSQHEIRSGQVAKTGDLYAPSDVERASATAEEDIQTQRERQNALMYGGIR